MWKYRLVFGAILVLTLSLSFTSLVFAQANALPGGNPNSIVPCNGPDCSFEDFVTLVQNIVNFLVYFAVVVAGLLFAWAGWLYLSSGPNPGQRTQAKKVFWNVTIGLAIMVGAWLVVDTLIKALTNSSFEWNKL